LRTILKYGYSEEQWAEIESSDMFQSEHFCGGYDADEKCFYFSYYCALNKEYWFSFDLLDVPKALETPNFVFSLKEAHN
jgi:hypothetical protein